MKDKYIPSSLLFFLCISFIMTSCHEYYQKPVLIDIPCAKRNYEDFLCIIYREGVVSEIDIPFTYKSKKSYVDPVITVIWGDGRILWSRDRLYGGPPYFIANLSQNRINEFREKIRGYLERENLNVYLSIPHAPVTCILICDGQKQLKMGSYHDIAETHEDIVATDRGLEDLRTRTREEVMSEQPVEYIDFRIAWSEIKSLIISMIPEGKHGKKIVRKLQIINE